MSNGVEVAILIVLVLILGLLGWLLYYFRHAIHAAGEAAEIIGMVFSFIHAILAWILGWRKKPRHGGGPTEPQRRPDMHTGPHDPDNVHDLDDTQTLPPPVRPRAGRTWMDDRTGGTNLGRILRPLGVLVLIVVVGLVVASIISFISQTLNLDNEDEVVMQRLVLGLVVAYLVVQSYRNRGFTRRVRDHMHDYNDGKAYVLKDGNREPLS